MAELSQQTGKSIKTLQSKFDTLNFLQPANQLNNTPINLIFDGTFFSRSDGVLVFRANQKNLHGRFIKSETVEEITLGLNFLDAVGYQLKSVTIDGRRGRYTAVIRASSWMTNSAVSFIKHKLFVVIRPIIQELNVVRRLNRSYGA